MKRYNGLLCLCMTAFVFSIVSTSLKGQMLKLTELEQKAGLQHDQLLSAFADAFNEGKCWRKGPLGIIAGDLFVDLDADKNTLQLSPGKSWVGKQNNVKQVVLVFNGNVAEQNELPSNFDLSQCVLVSFEGDKIRFLDFMSPGTSKPATKGQIKTSHF